MKQVDLKKKLNIPQHVIDEASTNLNPLSLVITDEFNSKNAKGNYRDRAIKRCLKAGVSFQSETNSMSNLFEKLVKVVNPITGKPMKYTGGGGNSDSMSLHFTDKSGMEISISLPHDAISVSFPKEKE